MKNYRLNRPRNDIIENFVVTIISFLMLAGVVVYIIINPDSSDDTGANFFAFAVLGGIFLVSFFAYIFCRAEYVELKGDRVHQHRFLLPDRSFSLNEVTGMRIIKNLRNPVSLELFCGDKKCFSLEEWHFDNNIIWRIIKDRAYPPKLYKGESDRHFTVGFHSGSVLKLIARVFGITACIIFAIVLISDDGLSSWVTEDYYLFGMPTLGVILATALYIVLNQKLYVDGEMLYCRRGFKKRKAHIGELRFEKNKYDLLKGPELVYRDSGKQFAKLSVKTCDNAYALQLYLEAHGIQWSALKL